MVDMVSRIIIKGKFKYSFRRNTGYFPICLIKPWVNQFVAREQCSLYNITQHCAVFIKEIYFASVNMTVRLLGIYQVQKLSSYGFPGYKL